MTWVIWRQYRVTAAIAGRSSRRTSPSCFLITGLQDAARWHAALASCAKNESCGDLLAIVSLNTGPVYTLTILTLAVSGSCSGVLGRARPLAQGAGDGDRAVRVDAVGHPAALAVRSRPLAAARGARSSDGAVAGARHLVVRAT